MLCPDCQIELKFDNNAYVGQILDCENCGAEMEIKSIEPFEIVLIEDEK